MDIKSGEFRQECPVIFGLGVVNNLADHVKTFNKNKVFCIFDGGVKASGIADRIVNLLEAAGIEVAAFDKVRPDPTDIDVDVAAEEARAKETDIVIGIGGGSVLDTAKIVGVLLKNPGKTSDYYLSKGAFPDGAAPIILIPTASGTGSEVTRVAVVSEHSNHAKDGVFMGGTLAIIDPELTMTCPPRVTAHSGLDALAHAVESYTALSCDPLSDLLALEAIRLIFENLRTAYKDGKNVQARENMSMASNFAGMAFNNTGVHFGHAFGHELGTVFGFPHGLACCYAMPEVVKFASKHTPERVKAIANAIKLDVSGCASNEEMGKKVATQFNELIKDCDIPSMKEQGLEYESVVEIAQGAIDHNGFYYNTPAPIPVEEFKEIIGEIYNNYL